MTSYYHFTAALAHTTAPAVHNAHHGSGRNRRAPRLSVSHNAHRNFRAARSLKDLQESAALSAFRVKFEAGRSFELDDDLEFCPNLLTETDMVSMSSASERSSLASNSPESSPTQQPQTVATSSLNSASPAFVPPSYQASQQSSLKLHQPAATRGRNAIPIVNPATGVLISSPSPSVSPALHPSGRRW